MPLKPSSVADGPSLLQMDFPTLPGSHRILNVHQNIPGVLKNVNNIIADLNVNIKAQVCLHLLHGL